MNYEKNNNIVTITFDDGKVNAVGLTFLEDINKALDRAEVDQAVDAGFIDEVVEADDLTPRTVEVAEKLAQLPQKHYAANKLLIRASSLQIMRDNIEQLASQVE